MSKNTSALNAGSSKLETSVRVLAIDPGYERVGIAILEKPKTSKETLVYSECFKTAAGDAFETRLLQIGKEVGRVITAYAPQVLAIETLYFNNNQKTAMRVAETRGAIIFIGAQYGLRLFEYTPLQIKSAVSGYGRSGKEEIARILPKLIDIPKRVKYDDEYDAIAVGLTCLASEPSI